MDNADVARILDREPQAARGNGEPTASKPTARRKRKPAADVGSCYDKSTIVARSKHAHRRPPAVASMPRLAVAVTICIGVAIPALTLTLSTLAGRLASSANGTLATACAAVGLAVLAVSLSHLAWAIEDITRSPRWASWLLAVACDLSIVLAECVIVFAAGAGCSFLACGLLIAVTCCSMLLNVWAFLRHR